MPFVPRRRTPPRAKRELTALEPRAVTCPVNPRVDCLKCHMPKVPSVVPHAMFTDHHIRIHSEAPADSGPRPK